MGSACRGSRPCTFNSSNILLRSNGNISNIQLRTCGPTLTFRRETAGFDIIGQLSHDIRDGLQFGYSCMLTWLRIHLSEY